MKNPHEENKEKLLLLDVSSLVYRAYYAMPEMTAKDGMPAGAVYGFVAILLKILRDRAPTYVAAALDLPGKTFRHETYEPYKATRPPTPEELIVQMSRIRELLEALDIPILAAEGFEADDAIATAVDFVRKKHPKIAIEIVSGDADVFQLVDVQTTVLAPRGGATDLIALTPQGVEKKLGVPPKLVTAYKALRGDPSDNIPGVRGIGEKTAVILLQYADSLEKLLELAKNPPKDAPKELHRFAAKLTEDEEEIKNTHALVTLRFDTPIRFDVREARAQSAVPPAFLAMLKRLGFESLLQRATATAGTRKKKEDMPESLEAFIAAQETQTEREIVSAQRDGIFSSGVATLERELIPVISAMERQGILVDREALSTLRTRLRRKQQEFKKSIFELAGREFNLASPKQMAEVLFSDLHIESRKKTKGGQRSTAAAVLEDLREAHPVVGQILAWREVTKLLTTYVETLPMLMDPDDGRIHARFWQLGTSTGRIASSDPNLQNIPVRGEDGRAVRNAFIAPKGKLLLSADYEQIELRVAAILSQDKEMLATFERGEDVHRTTAQRIFHVEPGDVTAEMRRRAKVLNFGILYGMGPRRVSREMGVPFDEGRSFLEGYFAAFPGLEQWIEKTKAEAIREGFTRTAFGRKRLFPELASSKPMIKNQAERAAVNAPIQGTAADLMKRGMVALAKRVPEAVMLVQVHDEILCEVAKGEVPNLLPRIQKALEGVWDEAPLPFPVRISVGERWGMLQKLKTEEG